MNICNKENYSSTAAQWWNCECKLCLPDEEFEYDELEIDDSEEE